MSTHTVASFVAESVAKSGRGCPTFMLRAAGFSAQDIKRAQERHEIESGRGKEGGFFPYGQKPEPRESVDGVSLKARMVALLTVIRRGEEYDATECDAVLSEYAVELAARQDAARHAREARAEKNAS